MHDVFMYLLRQYISDPTHVIDMSSLQVSDEGTLMAEPVHILDHRVRQLRCRTVDQVKVKWDSYSPHMICASSFHFCLIDRLTILWYL